MPPATDPVKTITMTGFVRAFFDRHLLRPDKPFCFVLGAGASRPSGIPTGEELVRGWLKEIHEDHDHGGLAVEAWATAANLEIPGFDHARAADFYSDVWARRFRVQEDGFAFLENLMEAKTPSFGYSVLAYLLSNTKHRVVITTNFDNLVADAVSTHSATFPRVVGHDELSRYVRADVRQPLIAKVHGDLGFVLKNGPREVAALPAGWAEALRRIMERFTPIFIGYGGNDGSLMNFLLDLEPGTPDTLWWCFRRGSPPHQRIREVVEKHRGFFVEIDGFDEIMMRLLHGLGGQAPDLYAELEQRSAKRLEDYRNQRAELAAKITQEQSRRARGARPHAAAGGTDAGADQVALREATKRLLDPSKDQKPWWVWQQEVNQLATPDAQDKKYQEAIRALPSDPNLLGNYAVLLWQARKNDDEAEAYYKRAIEADPKHANNLGNYASFQKQVRKDMDAAEALYKRAIDANPKDANNLGNYANFLSVVRKDMDAAEALYKRAIDASPNDANILGNYAYFLASVRREFDVAEAFYKRSIDIDSKGANSLGNYATFLWDVRKEADAAEALYKQSIEAEPKEANVLGNYAVFMKQVRRDMDAAEALYKSAIEADPNHANNLGNYANFLWDIRKDGDAAEKFYRRAIDADPEHVDNIGNYAHFLWSARKSIRAAEELYKRGIQIDPNRANLFGNYALMLFCNGESVEGARILECAEGLAPEHPSLRVELAYYRVAHVKESWPDSLAGLKELLTVGARSPGWPLADSVERARLDNHPEPDLVAALAAVVAESVPISSLELYGTWRNAG